MRLRHIFAVALAGLVIIGWGVQIKSAPDRHVSLTEYVERYAAEGAVVVPKDSVMLFRESAWRPGETVVHAIRQPGEARWTYLKEPR